MRDQTKTLPCSGRRVLAEVRHGDLKGMAILLATYVVVGSA